MSGGFVMGFDAVVVPPDASKSVLQQRIAELVAQHGGVRPAARVLEVDQGYVYRLLSGEKNDPGDKLLRKLKLRRIVTYERTDAAALATQAQQGEVAGWKLVPVEPTPEMQTRALYANERGDIRLNEVLAIYKTMLAASPSVEGVGNYSKLELDEIAALPDSALAAGFRDIASRSYSKASASLFRAHVIEKARKLAAASPSPAGQSELVGQAVGDALRALDEVIPPHLRASRHGDNFMGQRYEIIRAALSLPLKTEGGM